jgi:hypothetical protein
VRHGRHHQHDQVRIAYGIRKISSDQVDRHEAVVDSGDLDPTLPAKCLQSLLVPRMQANRKAAQAEVGRCRAATMPRPKNGNIFDHPTASLRSINPSQSAHRREDRYIAVFFGTYTLAFSFPF